jgi:hypothetical protein
LPRAAAFAETREHRVYAPGELHVTRDDLLAHSFVAAFFAQTLELVVQVEHQGRSRHPSRRPRGVGMKADDKEGRTAEA